MKIGFIGAGKVGYSLGKYFKSKGLTISGYYSRSKVSSEGAASFTESKSYTNLDNLINDSSIILITTNDNEINNVWNLINSYKLEDKIIAHCSGSISSKIFYKSLSNAYFYSIHPMFPFSDKFNSYKGLEKATFTIEGSEEKLNYLKNLLETLGNEVLTISSENKSLYHLANVFSSNLYTALVAKGVKMLNSIGIEETSAIRALSPLMESNVKNLTQFGPVVGLTGPVERGDSKTIEKHLNILTSFENKEIYKLLSKELVSLAAKKNPLKKYESIKSMLEEEI